MAKYMFILLLFIPLQIFAQPFKVVDGLISRRVPWLKGHVVFNQLKPSETDIIELYTQNGKLIINATGPNAAATGLNWYLKYYCHRSMSHMGDNLVSISPLPQVNKKIRIKAPSKYRYALNYCTYNYTMSFYNWQDWERELDWMALNGVNIMLSVNGMEAVWQNTLSQLGYSKKEIDDFIVGPAYTAWWLMGNIQKWGGPMPQSQIDSRKLLQQKIIKRMKELGIEPVMQGFYGMVPSTLKNKTKAHIIAQGNWGAFIRPDILAPGDTAFTRIAGIYYREMQKLYGKDLHFFAGDPFHEGGKTDGIDLKMAGTAIQTEMNHYFPNSIWLLQGWQDNPKKEMLSGLDKSKVMVLELFGEHTNNWEIRNGYENTNFIWCCVNNFGERPGVYGKLQRFADETYRIRQSPFKNLLQGVGITPEGINNNPAVYDLMLELGWKEEHINTEKWIIDYAKYRYGATDANINKAWLGFLETIYQSLPGYQEGASESVFCMRPTLESKPVSSWGTRKRSYDVTQFESAVKIFEKASPKIKNVETYKIDLINFVRQVLANKGELVFKELTTAYQNKDLLKFNIEAKTFLQMIRLTDDLLSTHPFYRLNTYKQQALRLGATEEEKRLNIKNAMMLITYWGENIRTEDNLHEYAYKEWSEMMTSFYLPRWEIYFNYLRSNLEGKQTETPDFFAWERKWVEENQNIVSERRHRQLQEVVNQILAL